MVHVLSEQNNCCALSGIQFSETNKMSLDRIRSNEGYVKGNVQFVLHDINRMKSNFEDEDTFMSLCWAVSQNQIVEK